MQFRCFQLLYRSKACIPVFSAEHLDMLRVAISSNRQKGVTGFLVRERDEFIQVLEGAQADVLGIYERIQRDRRHIGVGTLHQGWVPHRCFPNWDMGFTAGSGICELIDSTKDFGTVHDAVLARIIRLSEDYASKHAELGRAQTSG